VLAPVGSGPGLPVVLFLHGWRAIDPRHYRPWLVHLVREGNVVVYPGYQSPATPPARFLPNVIVGVRLARRLVRPATMVAVGHSAGGTLAADYAADACARGVPEPQAVMSVFPAGRLGRHPERIPRRPWRNIPRAVRVLVLAGARDHVAGTAQAEAVATRAASARLELVARPGADTHLAPQTDTAVVRRVFWRRLDAVIAQARARPPVRCRVPSR
jgi:dienelactone hydrolase